METLDRQGVADNTLVIFTSDNGGMLNMGGQDAWSRGHRLNGDLLGFKFDAWEGGHRVPFIARWPGKIEAGTRSDQLICNVDMLATFASVANTELTAAEGPDSFNVLPTMVGDPTEPIRDHAVLAARQPSHLSIRQGPWMLIGAQGGGGFTAVKRGAHTFGGPSAMQFTGQVNSDVSAGKIRPDAPKAQLYNLDTDPYQSKNVIRENPEVADQLKQRLEKIRRVPTRPGL